jgi:hypothetical protein
VLRFKAFALNLLTVIMSVGVTLIAAEMVLRFLPVAVALPVERPTSDHPIQRYVANHPYVWSIDWTMHDVVRGRSNAQGHSSPSSATAISRRSGLRSRKA